MRQGAIGAGRGTVGRGAAGGKLVALAVLFGAVGCDDDGMQRIDGELQVEGLVDFGGVSLGRQKLRHVTLRNLGRAPIRVALPAFEEPAPVDFAVTYPAVLVLEGGDTTKIALRFQPAALGQRAARLRFETDAVKTPAADVELRGLGVLGRADANVTRLDFGKVALGDTYALPFSFVNAQGTDAEVTVLLPTGDDPLDFVSDPRGVLVVEKRQERVVSVSFSPSHLGPHAARLEFLPCPTCAPEAVELVGEGIAATLVADPLELHFGFVAPGGAVTRTVTFTNLGSRPVTLQGAHLGQTSDPAFTTAGLPNGPVTLGPGESVTVEVSFSPSALDDANGMLRVETREGSGANERRGQVSVLLDGYGGGPDIDVRPVALGFPRTGVGLVVEKRVMVANVGHDPQNQRPLLVTDFFIDGATSPNGGEFSVTAENGAWRPGVPFAIPTGVSKTLVVRYAPSAAGDARANLHIVSNDGDEPLVIVPITASATELGPCTYRVLPERLDFGAVPTGASARLSFSIRNEGSNACAVANIRLSRSTPPPFTLDPISSRLVDPGDTLVVTVAFTPTSDAAVTGRVEFDVTSPAAPQGEVPLVARGLDACLEIAPQQVDFGTVGLACQPPVRSVTLRNTCSQPVALARAWVGTGVSDVFELDAASAAPRTLAPGGEARLDLTYTPDVEGTDTAPLYLDLSITPSPVLVGLEGEALLRPMRTDTFIEPPLEKVDFLFVIDNSGSLMEEQEALSRNFDRFIQTAYARGTDFRLAVTTTGLTSYRGGWATCPGGVDGGENGRFFPVDNSRERVLSPQTPDLKNVFQQNVKVGVCHWWEDGLEAARLALSPPLIDNADDPRTPNALDGNAGFLREDARLYVLFVSDEEDVGTVPVDDYVTFLRGLKPGRPDHVSASAIVGLPSCATAPSVGSRYMALVGQLGGMVADICSPDWGGILQKIGEDAFNPNTTFPLEEAPDGRDITVYVNGVEVAEHRSNGDEQWHFDPTIGAYGAVVFAEGNAPGPNSRVEVRYPVPCPEVRVSGAGTGGTGR